MSSLKRAYFLFLIYLFKEICSNCPDFNFLGYKPDAYQIQNGFEYCSVSCDVKNNFFPSDINIKFNGTIGFHTIYSRKPQGKWEPMFVDVIGSLNCQKGCNSPVKINAPYFIYSTEYTVSSSNPLRYYRSRVQCQEGYFSMNEVQNNEDTKIFMDCSRTKENAADSWKWTEGSNVKLECVPGCKRYGAYHSVHQNSFGVDSKCNHIGNPEDSLINKVSSCDLTCDEENGYFAVFENAVYLECGSNGYYKLSLPNYACEQGCQFSSQIEDDFKKKNFKITCSSPINDNWYGKCNVKCLNGVSVTVEGRFGHSDLVFCRLGKWNYNSIIMRCG